MSAKTNLQIWYDFALQQMAAEGYLDKIELGNTDLIVQRAKFGNNDLRPTVLVNGQSAPNQLRAQFPDADENTPIFPGATRLTGNQADYFFRNWDIIDHAPSDASGFSATLFRNRETGAYTFSIRSTEFAKQEFGGDRQRDIGSLLIPLSITAASGADMEIGWYGLALGQIDSMERYYQRLRDSGALPQGATVNVTGYSLGGHLATAFAELHAGEIGQVVEFNAAGRGSLLSGWNVPSLLDAYRGLLANPLSIEAPAQQLPYTTESIRNLRDAAVRDRRDITEQPNVYSMPRHRWAMFVMDQFMTGTLAATVLGSADAIAANADSKITYLYGMGSHNDETGTSRSGVTPGNQQIVFIEDQPNFYGAAGLLSSSFFPDSVPTWWKGDFLRTHSITLLADSLALMGLFQKFDPSLTQAQIETIFGGASNKRGESGLFSPKVESDSLENALDALWRIFKDDSRTPIDDTPVGFGNLANREEFHGRISQLEEIAARAATGAFSIHPIGAMSWVQAGIAPVDRLKTFEARAGAIDVDELIANARDDGPRGLAYRYALRELNPFAVVGPDYERFNRAGELEIHDPDTGQGSLTNEWLSDRAQLLAWRVARNINDSSDPVIFGNLDRSKDFTVIAADGTRETLRVTGTTLSVPSQTSQVVFGGSAEDRIEGFGKDDHVYGEGGDDDIQGREGSDHLQGDAGSDRLDGGAGADTLLGGSGNDSLNGGPGSDRLEGGRGFDTYEYRTGDGTDVLADADGSGQVIYDGVTLGGGQKGSDGLYWNADRSIYYSLLGGAALDINGQIRVPNFRNGDLGIVLTGGDQTPQPPGTNAGGEWTYDDYPVADQQLDENGFPIADPPHYFWGSPHADTYVSGPESGPYFNGREGNDLIRGGGVLLAIPAKLVGGTGDDVILNFPAENHSTDPITQPHLLAGEAGRDFIQGSDDAEALFGDFYSIRLTVGPTGTPNIDADLVQFRVSSDSSPRLDFFTPNSFLAVQLGLPALSTVEFDDEADALDMLVGEPAPDGFDDYLDAGAGDDYLIGGSGSDVLLGGEGNDRLFGDGVQDGTVPYYFSSIAGNADEELIARFGAPGDDFLDGGPGDDTINDAAGETSFAYGGAGNDEITVHVGTFEAFGEEDAATFASRGFAVVDGGDGDDVIDAVAPDVDVAAGAGNDTIAAGGTGMVTIDAGAGDDAIEAGGGLLIIHGGAGSDLYRVRNTTIGTVFIRDEGGAPGDDNRLELKGAPGDYFVSRQGPDLVLDLDPALVAPEDLDAGGLPLSVTIEDWFGAGSHKMARIAFESGAAWNASDAEAAVPQQEVAASTAEVTADPFAPDNLGPMAASDDVRFSEPPADAAVPAVAENTPPAAAATPSAPGTSETAATEASGLSTDVAVPVSTASTSGSTEPAHGEPAFAVAAPDPAAGANTASATAVTLPDLAAGANTLSAAVADSTVNASLAIPAPASTGAQAGSPTLQNPAAAATDALAATIAGVTSLGGASAPARTAAGQDLSAAALFAAATEIRKEADSFFERIAPAALATQSWLNDPVAAGARPQRSETRERGTDQSSGAPALSSPPETTEPDTRPPENPQPSPPPDEIARLWSEMHAWNDAHLGFDAGTDGALRAFPGFDLYGVRAGKEFSIGGAMAFGRTPGIADLNAGNLRPLEGLKEGLAVLA